MRVMIITAVLYLIVIAIIEWWRHYKNKKMAEYRRLTGKHNLDPNDPEWQRFLIEGRLKNGTST